jgi:adenylate cyclase
MVYVTTRADEAVLERPAGRRLNGYAVERTPAPLPARTAPARPAAAVRPRGPFAPAPAPRLRAVHPAGAPGAQPVRRQLEHLFASPDFDASPRSREFLRFVTEETLAGREASLTQSAIAVRVFGRKEDFDAVVDPIVRIQAGRLRRSLERYYLLSGRHDAVRIELPKGGYVPAFLTTATEAAGAAESAAAPPEDGWPSVFLQSFEVAGALSGLEELAIRVDEELALELGRFRAAHLFREREDGFVPRPHVRFSLGGRIRREENEDVRVTAYLVDRATGEQIWGDEYCVAAQPGRWSGSPEDIARVIAVRVGAEEGVIAQCLIAERRKRRPAAPTVYDAVLQAYEYFLTREANRFAAAVDGLRQAVAHHPDSSPSWTQLARLILARRTGESAGGPTLAEAVACAQRGVRLDPASRGARCVLAAALLATGEASAAREELDQVLRSSPGSLVHLENIGALLTRAGDPARGAGLSRTARERNPHCLPRAMFGT